RLLVCSSRCSPEPFQRLTVRGFPQLLERPLAYLPDPLSRDAHEGSDLFERHRLAPLLEAVIEIQDLALARRQVLLEDAVDELAHQAAVGFLLDLPALLPGEPLAQRGGIAIAAVHRRIERQLGGRHAARRAHVLYRVLERSGDLVVGGFAPQLLGQVGLGAALATQLRVLIQWDAAAARLLGERLLGCLLHPSYVVWGDC